MPNFDVTQRLKEANIRTLGQSVPVPLHERVEALCDLVYASGRERPSKVKMLSALMLDAPADADELDRRLRAFDAASVGDALLGSHEVEDNVVKFPKRTSGPRPRPGA